MKRPTRLEDARTLKQMGLPLTMPVEHRTFSEHYSRHWIALMEAHAEFMLAMREVSDTQSSRKWKLVQRRFIALDKAAGRCMDFTAELGGNVAPDAEPIFKSEQDRHEYALLGWFIDERALPFIRFWADALDAVDAGEAPTIEPSEIPPWTDEDRWSDNR